MGNIFAIGDIHGCLDKLQALMDNVGVDFNAETDTLVFLGDYIDRGRDSYEVVDYLIDIKTLYRNCIFLKGNHEEMLEKYLTGPDRYTYLVNGGQQTLDSYLNHSPPGAPPIPDSHMDFFNSLVLYYETDRYIFVHAALRIQVPLDMQHTDDLVWIREEFIYSN